MDYGEKMVIATMLRFRDIKNMIHHVNNENSRARFLKHNGVGSNIKRRNKKKELLHGKYKSMRQVLSDVLAIKSISNIDERTVKEIKNDEYSMEKINNFIQTIKNEMESGKHVKRAR